MASFYLNGFTASLCLIDLASYGFTLMVPGPHGYAYIYARLYTYILRYY